MSVDRHLLIVIVLPIPPTVRVRQNQDRPIVCVTPVAWDPRLERVEVLDPRGNTGRVFFRPRMENINP
jgi:hypothetical protein